MTEAARDIRATAARTVYLDHGATSWPKPQPVVQAVREAVEFYGGNPGRGAYELALATARLIHDARRTCAALLGVRDPSDLAFVSGATEALNIALKGLLAPGDRVVACSMEHNAVVRPLNVLAAQGVDVVWVDADSTGLMDADEVEAAVRRAPTRAVVCQHASNVTGTIQPVGDLADVAHASGAWMIVDGAQAAGHLDIDVAALGADVYAVSGHKGLLGPQGVGLLCLSEACEPRDLVQGGTGGGASELPTQPTARPDRYEAGTPNTPGIAGAGAAAAFVAEHGHAQHGLERELVARLHEGVLALPGFRVLGSPPREPRVPVLSVVHERVDADQLAFLLDKRYGIAARAGLHCAPAAHRTLGTLATGALRFGIGWGNTAEHVDLAVQALAEAAG
ncbi:MAG: cysteine desulfurase [Coriobacteriaceae bacterium]|nr:cysteine desulfurase [Coriobacteriaceae bacterium]